MLLADKADRMPEEDKKLNALVRAEKAAVFAAKTLGDAPRLGAAEIFGRCASGGKGNQAKAGGAALLFPGLGQSQNMPDTAGESQHVRG